MKNKIFGVYIVLKTLPLHICRMTTATPTPVCPDAPKKPKGSNYSNGERMHQPDFGWDYSTPPQSPRSPVCPGALRAIRREK